MPATRLARLARAANVTRWFNNPVSDSEDHYRNYLGAADLQLLRELKITALRLVVNPELIFDPSKPTAFSDKMHYLDDAVDWLIANKIAVVIELHDKKHMSSWENDAWYVDLLIPAPCFACLTPRGVRTRPRADCGMPRGRDRSCPSVSTRQS